MKGKILFILLIFLVLLPWPVRASLDVEAWLEQLDRRVTALELSAPTSSTNNYLFDGRGNSQTFPFNISHSPWQIVWWANVTQVAGTTLNISINTANGTEGQSKGNYSFYVMTGNQTGQTVSYLPIGRYYFAVDTGSYVLWSVGVN